MEVVNSNAALLCNYEVLTYLRSLSTTEKGKKKMSNDPQQLATIVYETTKYLENTPCNLQNAEVIKAFVDAVKPYELTKMEILQLLNQRPTTEAKIHAIIEDSEDRFENDQILALLEIISEKIPTDQVDMVCETQEQS